jgi:hypothetical protein
LFVYRVALLQAKRKAFGTKMQAANLKIICGYSKLQPPKIRALVATSIGILAVAGLIFKYKFDGIKKAPSVQKVLFRKLLN